MKNNENILVTVVISYYNDKEYLAQSIDSVLKQTYGNFELILFNHASTDGSRDIAHSFNDPRIIHIDGEKNMGASGNHNFLSVMPYMHGDWLKIFCADDVMHPDCLKNLVEYANDNPDKDFIFGNMEFIDANGKSLHKDWFSHIKKPVDTYSEIDVLRIFKTTENFVPYPAAIIRMQKFKSVKLDTNLTVYADLLVWISLLLNNAKIAFYNKIVVFYRRHKYQESAFNSTIIRKRAEFEKNAITQLFIQTTDINLVKQVFNDSPYISKLVNVQDIPFIVAEYFLREFNNQFAYITLYNMLNNSETAQHLSDVFEFDVLAFRKLYALSKQNHSFKQRLAEKNPKELSLIDLLFLMARKVLKGLGAVIKFGF